MTGVYRIHDGPFDILTMPRQSVRVRGSRVSPIRVSIWGTG